MFLSGEILFEFKILERPSPFRESLREKRENHDFVAGPVAISV